MQNKLTEKIKNDIVSGQMILPGDLVLAGVSGGADSVALLFLLREMQQEIDFELRVLHVEHGIRGEESQADAAYVQALCDRIGVACKTVPVCVPELVKDWKIGTEEAARKARYEIFREEASRAAANGARVRIAVAHHENDQAETVLFRMVRGSGVEGLCGMREVNDDIIRPLLHVKRSEIEVYLQELGVEYREDLTNEDIAYARNRIRQLVLPELEKINAQAVSHIAESAKRLSQAQDYLKQQTTEAYAKCVVCEKDAIRILLPELRKQHLYLQKEVLRKALAHIAGSEKDLGNIQVEQLYGLSQNRTGRSIDLPYGVTAKRNYDELVLRMETENAPACEVILTEVLPQDPKEEALLVEVLGWRFRISVVDHYPDGEEGKKKFTKYLNYDKIITDFSLRNAREGDYLVIDENGSRQKLSRYFINRKIPQEKRPRIPVFAQGEEVFWIAGERMSESAKVCADTKRILRIEAYPPERESNE